ncbi:hypothetical protein BDQ17DRAFT_1413515 [Cyathus striatus]|nr:hypothetical protein BDQ17DRAFT_1413515 [Cyathus striatus]
MYSNTPLHDPRDTVIRKVLLYPADGTELRLVEMEFSEEGAKRPFWLYTTALDLRNTYGKSIGGTRIHIFNVTNQPPELAINEGGDHVMHFNIDIRLPINLSVSRLIGINPKHPGHRPMFRGDLIFTREDNWPPPIVIGGGAHRNYFDVDASFRQIADNVITQLYNSERWGKYLDEEQAFHNTMNPDPSSHPDPDKYMKKLKDHAQQQRMLDRAKKYSGRQMALENDLCAHCTNRGNPTLKNCSGCRQIKYCSKECQKADWKRHKSECRSSLQEHNIQPSHVTLSLCVTTFLILLILIPNLHQLHQFFLNRKE